MSHDNNEPLGRTVERARVEALYAKLLTPMLAVLANSALVAFVLWSRVDHALLCGWVAAAWLVAGVRLSLGRAYRRSPHDARDYARWGRLFAVGSGFNGVVWGAGAAVLYPPDAIALQVLVVFVVGGMVAGAAASTSTFMPAFIAFALPAIGGTVARLVVDLDRVHLVMAVMLLLFAAAMTAIARRGGQMLITSERLRLVNDALAGKLAEARDQLIAANESLERRVRVRAREAEEAMAHIAQTDLLASIGQLASGVAHEINNPLSVIISNVEQLKDDLEPTPDSELAEMLDDASVGADRIKRIVADLRLLARARTDKPHAIETEPLLRSCTNLLVHQLRQRAQVIWELGEDVPKVHASEAAFAQISLNLLLEAMQAIPPGKPGEYAVRITTSVVGEDAAAAVDGAENRRVRVAIRYEGDRVANNTGGHDSLGLAICRNVLSASGGSLDYSHDTSGTTAIVTLRAAG